MNTHEDSAPCPLQEFQAGESWVDSDDPGSGFDAPILSDLMLRALERMHRGGKAADIVQVLCPCIKLGEPVLLAVGVDAWVWPITVLPAHGLYRAPVDFSQAPPPGLCHATLVDCGPAPHVPPLRSARQAFSAPPCHYALGGLLWTFSLLGPRRTLVDEVAGAHRYRVTARPPRPWHVSGAMGSAIDRLLNDAASLAEISAWPGLSTERASRLLNALYLEGSLQVDEGAAASPRTGSRWGGWAASLHRRRPH